MEAQKFFKVKLIKSTIGCTQKQKETIRCLGLRKIGSQRVFLDAPTLRGQILKVQHLLDVQVREGN